MGSYNSLGRIYSLQRTQKMIVDYTKTDGGAGTYSMANWTAQQLDKIKDLISKKDRDYVVVIDGEEGAGKSTFASQMAHYVDRTFDQSMMSLTPDEFLSNINRAKKSQAVVFDEAFTGLASRSSLSQVNKMIVELMMEMRKKNLFVIICIPSVFYLEKYVCLHRARALFHTYISRGKRGAYFVYNQRKLKQLYIYGKREMSYRNPRVKIYQRFVSSAPIDWVSYEKRKVEALQKKDISIKGLKQMNQRDFLISFLYYSGYTEPQMEEIFTLGELPTNHTVVSDSIKRYKKKFNPNWLKLMEIPPKRPKGWKNLTTAGV